MRVNRIKAMTGATWLAWLALLALGAAATWLAVHRIYQVDEAQNLTMIRVLATGQSAQFFTNALLWMLGPMSWLVGALDQAVPIFTWSRLLFLGVFFLNIYLLALNTGARLGSFGGAAALLGAATLAPLWDFGFEIRHDNLILTGLLLMWWMGRVAPRGVPSYLGLGFLSVFMPCLSLKAILYAAPLSLALLALPPPGHARPYLTLLRAWLIGAAGAAALVALAYAGSGAWPVFLAGLQSGAASGAEAMREDPMLALTRLPRQVPMLLELAVTALCWVLFQFLLEGWRALRWDGLLPEALLLLASLAVLLINPTPFAYNLVNMVPFAYLLVFRFVEPMVRFNWPHPDIGAVLCSALLVWHLIPFYKATQRHFSYSNARQHSLMRTAEALTDPQRDRVYDAAGLVPTRASIGYYWYNHSLNKAAFASGRHTPVASMLAERPAAVVIRSYRTQMLPESGQQFIDARYLALTDDLMVLGQELPPGGGTYQVLHPGRYVLVQRGDKQWLPLPAALVAGKPAGSAPLTLAPGALTVQTDSKVRPAVVWVGPTLDAVPVFGNGYRLRVFRNFY
jgi:hypothetical protein